jgi:hypothetical protein
VRRKRSLQTALERSLDEVPQHLLAGLLAEKLAEHRVELSDGQRKAFAKRLLRNNGKSTSSTGSRAIVVTFSWR